MLKDEKKEVKINEKSNKYPSEIETQNIKNVYRDIDRRK